MPHLFRGRVFFPVTIPHGLPSACDRIAGNKDRRARPRITIHKAVDIAAVPCGLLRGHDRANGGGHFFSVRFGSDCCTN